jgi:hypothetical protein
VKRIGDITFHLNYFFHVLFHRGPNFPKLFSMCDFIVTNAKFPSIFTQEDDILEAQSKVLQFLIGDGCGYINIVIEIGESSMDIDDPWTGRMCPYETRTKTLRK